MSFVPPSAALFLGGQLPRTPYQVLDVSPDERDPQAIEEAALRCSSQVRAYQLTCEVECARRLSEIAQALIWLLDVVSQGKSDRSPGSFPSPVEPERRLAARGDARALPPDKDAPPARDNGAHVLLLGEGGTCDVKLVCRRQDRRDAGPTSPPLEPRPG